MAIDNISMEEKIEELRKAMPNQTQFVNGIIEDWKWLINDCKSADNKIKEEFEETIEVLVFNTSGQSDIYADCNRNYSWNLDTIISDDKRMKRIEELIYSRKQYEMCYTKSIYLGDILANMS